jgi:hypothetical protein
MGLVVYIVLAKQVLYHLTQTSSPFWSDYFGDRGLMNYFPRLALNLLLPISASKVARITGVSHWRPGRVLL